MSLVLNNVTTDDDFTLETTITDRVCDRVNIIITGVNGVLYELQTAGMEGGANVGSWYPARYLPGEPSGGNFAVSLSRRCSGFRVRSAVAGAPAQVTAEMVPGNQLGSALV